MFYKLVDERSELEEKDEETIQIILFSGFPILQTRNLNFLKGKLS